jgi:hypothetical protein
MAESSKTAIGSDDFIIRQDPQDCHQDDERRKLQDFIIGRISKTASR